MLGLLILKKKMLAEISSTYMGKVKKTEPDCSVVLYPVKG